MLRRHQLDVVSGTATYTLPSDFLFLVEQQTPMDAGEPLIIDAGIIPVSADFKESFEIAGGQITFYPTPSYSATRYLWYAAGHVLASDSYALMTNADVPAILLKAQSVCLNLQANVAAQEAWNYAYGDEKVSKEKLAESLQKQSEKLQAQYEKMVATMIGPVGMRPYAD